MKKRESLGQGERRERVVRCWFVERESGEGIELSIKLTFSWWVCEREVREGEGWECVCVCERERREREKKGGGG